MAVKRRILWFTDDDWARMQAVAARRETTVSRFLGELAMHEVTMDEREAAARAKGQTWRDAEKVAGVEASAIRQPAEPKARAARMTQADRDAVLKAMVTGGNG